MKRKATTKTKKGKSVIDAYSALAPIVPTDSLLATQSGNAAPLTRTDLQYYETDPEQDLIAADGELAGELNTNPDVQVKKALHYRVRPPSLVEPCNTLSTEKRATKLRDKIGVAADYLADELMFAVSSKTKKDKEYIKGLVWSLGVLFDKLNTGNADTVHVKLPAKLLENIKVVIAIQAEKKSTLRSLPSEQSPSVHDVIDVSPSANPST